MNETQAWFLFESTGKVEDYLNYKGIMNQAEKKAKQITQDKYENFDHGTDTQTTEYR